VAKLAGPLIPNFENVQDLSYIISERQRFYTVLTCCNIYSWRCSNIVLHHTCSLVGIILTCLGF